MTPTGIVGYLSRASVMNGATSPMTLSLRARSSEAVANELLESEECEPVSAIASQDFSLRRV